MYSIICLDNLFIIKTYTSDYYIDQNGLREWIFYVETRNIVSVIPKDITTACSEYTAIADSFIQSGCMINASTSSVTTHSIICIYLN